MELNEAFAVQSLVYIDAWDVDPEIVNVRGGAIAIGHPLGHPEDGSSARSPKSCGSVATAGESPRSASVLGKVSRSCWRTLTPKERQHRWPPS